MTNSSTATQEDGDKLKHVGIKNGPNEKLEMFDVGRTQRLHTAYNQAVADQAEIIEFEGLQMVTNYAKYLLEYLDGRLE